VGFPVFVASVLLFQVLRMHHENYLMIGKLAEATERMRIAIEHLSDLLMRASELRLRVKE